MSTKMNLPDAGISRGGHERAEGIATETFGREDDPEIYQKEIDERITKIRPMATPIDQILEVMICLALHMKELHMQ